jgi:uncharacterized protein
MRPPLFPRPGETQFMSEDTTTADHGPTALTTEPEVGPDSAFPACEYQGTPDVVDVPPAKTDADPAPAIGPVKPEERVSSVDVLRGVALLGILAMNIVNFGWPDMVYANPVSMPGYTKVDVGLWTFNHLVFDTKMMSLFSMLFGAGLVLMGDRADAKGRSFVGFYYRRVLWLLAIGLVHAYLIWSGDILVMYAQCGLLLYPLRRLAAHRLIILGICLQLVLIPLLQGVRMGIDFMKVTAAKVEAMEQASGTPQRWQKKIATFYKEKVAPNMDRSPEKKREQRKEHFDKETLAYRGDYAGIVSHRAKNLFTEHTIGFLLGGWWFVGGRMLIGMGLMKLGAFAASRSKLWYLGLMALGYGLGMPLVIWDTITLIRHDFDSQELLSGGIYFNFYGGLLVAVGHAGLVMLIYQGGHLKWLTNRLAAVGRMALSNYLFDSLFCTFLFYGYGISLYAMLDRAQLYMVVLGIWTFQLLMSPIWLQHYRFGPAEWLWRSLTYWKLQPMRVNPAQAPAPVPLAA